MSEANHTPWKFVGNNWQYTTIYNANGVPICQLDLEDWGVTEENQDELEAEQTKCARLIAAAPELLRALEAIVNDGGEFSTTEMKRVARDAIKKARVE